MKTCKKKIINGESLLKYLKLDECTVLSEFEEIEIDMSKLCKFFDEPCFEFGRLMYVFKNIESIKISADVRGFSPVITWRIYIDKNLSIPVEKILSAAKKYRINNVIIADRNKNAKKDLLDLFSETNYKKIYDFIKNTSAEALKFGVSLRIIERFGL